MLSMILRIAVGYGRVSGLTQANNFSLITQDEDIRDYAEHDGIAFDRMFTDVGSGLSAKHRPGFTSLREYALDDKNKVTDLVFWELDRFTRNIEDFFTFTKPLLEKGITLHIALDGEKYDYVSQEKWHQRLIAAQAESKKISRRTKRGQRKATSLGLHIGTPPWGYILIHDSQEVNDKGEPIMCGRLVRDPDLWDHLLKMWSMADEGSTPMQIARYNNQHNVPSPSGGPWTDGAVRYILKNEKYCGNLFRGRQPQTRLPGPKENARETYVENAHQAAVSPEVFKKVQKAIKSRHREQGSTRCHSSPNPASGLLKCGPCWSRDIDSNLQIHRQGDTVRLRCGRKKSGSVICSFKNPRLESVLDPTWKRLKNFLTPEILGRIVHRVGETSGPYLEEQEKERTGIREHKSVVRGEIKNLKEILLDRTLGPRTRRSYTQDLEKLLTEEEELEQADSRITEATSEARIFINNPEGIIETAMNLKTFTDPEDLEAVRELLHIFIERVEVFPDGHAFIQYDLPVRCEESEDELTREIIYFETRKKRSKTIKTCVIDGTTGLRRE